MKTHKFARKPFYVDAVRVSENNINEVAEWCSGVLMSTEDEKPIPYIKVEVHRPLNERQTEAYIGDWVLDAGSGFKVYTPKAFDKSFEKVRTLTKAQADEAGIKVPHEPRPTSVSDAFKRAEANKEAKQPVSELLTDTEIKEPVEDHSAEDAVADKHVKELLGE